MSGPWSAPAGRLVLPVGADRAEWLRVRTRGIGGSDIATILGHNKYGNAFGVWQDKTDPRIVEEPSEAQWWGQQTEALTTERFEAITGIATRRAGTYAHRVHPHHMVNPDRFTADGGVLEVKDHESLSDAGKTVLRGDITDHAYVQLMWACHVTGRTHGWFAAKVGKQTRVLGPFPADEAVIAHLVAAADEFWALVESRTPPPVDYASVTADEVAARFPTVTPESAAEVYDLPIPDMVLDDLDRLAEIRDLGVQYAAEREAIETRLKARIGEREFLTVHGRPVLRWQQVAGRRQFDKAAAVGRLAELTGRPRVEVEAELTVQGSPTRRFAPVESKEKVA